MSSTSSFYVVTVDAEGLDHKVKMYKTEKEAFLYMKNVYKKEWMSLDPRKISTDPDIFCRLLDVTICAQLIPLVPELLKTIPYRFRVHLNEVKVDQFDAAWGF